MNKQIFEKFKNSIKFESEIGKKSWMGCGGVAQVLFKPNNKEDLIHFLKDFSKEKIEIIGACSNTIIRDGGVEEIVIKLGQGFSYINIITNPTEEQISNATELLSKQNITNKEPIIIETGCATLDSTLSSFCVENNIGGLEFLSTIPGTIGGNIKMNAGCYKKEISEVLISVETIDTKEGDEKTINRKNINFSYRKNPMSDNLIFTKAMLCGYREDQNIIKEKINAMEQQRDASQPVRTKTSGSTFINPSETNKAWELIDKVGLRGKEIGGAKFSEKHCNFIINHNNGTSQNIEDLIHLAQEKVKNKFNIELISEVKIIGKK